MEGYRQANEGEKMNTVRFKKQKNPLNPFIAAKEGGESFRFLR